MSCFRDPGTPYFDGRLGVMDAAIGQLQSKVEEQQEQIDKLLKLLELQKDLGYPSVDSE